MARKPDHTPQRPQTPSEIAAEYLRKYMPVHRCNECGGYMKKGLHWRAGSSVLTTEELIAKADKYRGMYSCF